MQSLHGCVRAAWIELCYDGFCQQIGSIRNLQTSWLKMQLCKQCFSRPCYWSKCKSRSETSFLHWSLASHQWQNALFVVKSALLVGKRLLNVCIPEFVQIQVSIIVHTSALCMSFKKWGQLPPAATSMQLCGGFELLYFICCSFMTFVFLFIFMLYNVRVSTFMPAVVAGEETPL